MQFQCTEYSTFDEQTSSWKNAPKDGLAGKLALYLPEKNIAYPVMAVTFNTATTLSTKIKDVDTSQYVPMIADLMAYMTYLINFKSGINFGDIAVRLK